MVRLGTRFIRIVSRLLPFAIAFLRDRHRFILFGRSREISPEQHRERARRLRETMLTLGPTFIKTGQVLSTRPDVVPQEYAQEFATLQDAVPSGPYREMIPTLAEDVGYHTFDSFDPEPFAGGSLAQVYHAVYQGEDVVVKVRRPNIQILIETDLKVIRTLLPVVARVAPEQHQFSLRNMADDFERIILEELDFEREAEMMTEIRDNFTEDSTVRIPQVYQEASSGRVLTMERIEGTKITDVAALEQAGLDPHTIADNVANAYFMMGLEHGVFHGDPHPGNLAVTDGGQIVFYDFGMSGRFTPEMQEMVIQLYLAVVRRDVDEIMDLLIAIDALDPNVDRAKVTHVLSLLIEDLEGRSDTNWRVILDEVLATLHDFPFRIPPDMMLVIRVGTVSEGVLRQLDPEFDFIRAAREFLIAHGFMEQGARMLFEQTRTEFEEALRSLLRLPPKLERTLDVMAQDEEQFWRQPTSGQTQFQTVTKPLGYVLLTGFTIIGASLITFIDPRYGVVGFVVAVIFFLLFYTAGNQEQR